MYDSFDIEYHLTPVGWVKGTEWEFNRKDKEVPSPSDRVLTLLLSVRQSSGWSRESVAWKESWRAPSITDEELEILQKKFPRPGRFSS